MRKVPRELNNITKLNEHFSKFGTIVNIQVIASFPAACPGRSWSFTVQQTISTNIDQMIVLEQFKLGN